MPIYSSHGPRLGRLETWPSPVVLLQAYEARLNPFVEFQQHETESHVNKLNLHDRALLSGSRWPSVTSCDKLYMCYAHAFCTLWQEYRLHYSLLQTATVSSRRTFLFQACLMHDKGCQAGTTLTGTCHQHSAVCFIIVICCVID